METNRHQLEKWIKEHFKSSAFNTCPLQLLQAMAGKLLDVAFVPGAKPTAVYTPISEPHHWKKRVKQDLDRDVTFGIIVTVQVRTLTTWCSRMMVIPRKDSSPRHTVDLQKLNAITIREINHTPSSFNQVSIVLVHTRKMFLDTWNGYHSFPLSAFPSHTWHYYIYHWVGLV